MQRFISFILSLIILFFAFVSCSKKDSLKLNNILYDIQVLKKQNDSLLNVITGIQKKSDSVLNAIKINNQSISTLSLKIDSIKTQLSLTILQINALNSQLSLANANISLLQGQIQELQLKVSELVQLLNQLLNQTSTLNSGLLAYYPFSGNVGDSSGNGNHGTVVNSIVYTTDNKGFQNSAIDFKGGFGGGRITTNNSFFNFQYTGTFSICFWFMDRGANNSNGRLISTENPEGSFRISTYRNGIYAISMGDAPYVYDTVSVNTWNHIVFTYSNGNSKLYKNGVLKSSVILNASGVLNHNVFTIGAKASSSFDVWNGFLDELRIYDREITSKEVAEIYKK